MRRIERIMPARKPARRGQLVLFSIFIVIPFTIFATAVLIDGRPHHQEMVVTALSGDDPLGGIPVRILIDQGATCDGDGHELTADARGVAGVSHVAKLGVLEVREQSVAVCLPDKGEWILVWSSRHESVPALLSIACDATDASAPQCEARFKN